MAGVATALSAIELSDDHIARGWRGGVDAGHFLRSAQTKCAAAVRDLQIILSTAAADDPNRDLIEAAIEALR
jgi:hypothetical protein